MNMIQKMYNCVLPVESFFSEGMAQEYQVSAWQAMGSDTINYRLRDGFGWYSYGGLMPEVTTEKLSMYAGMGIKSMDDLIEYLFYVVKA
jgi:hypothetical protein